MRVIAMLVQVSRTGLPSYLLARSSTYRVFVYLSTALAARLVVRVSYYGLVSFRGNDPAFYFLLYFSKVFGLQGLRPYPIYRVLRYLPGNVVLVFRRGVGCVPTYSTSRTMVRLLHQYCQGEKDFLVVRQARPRVNASSFIRLRVLKCGVCGVVLRPSFFGSVI